MATLSISNIRKSFSDTPILSDISLEVQSGEFVALLGASGCGKSTLLRIIAGLEEPDSGSIAIAGKCVEGLLPSQRDVAMVFQNYALYPHKSIAANIALPLEMGRLRGWQRLPGISRVVPSVRALRSGIARDVSLAAHAVGISALLARKPSQLSGGQRQRAALARAIVRQPQLFLMDEPLSNLDAKLRAKMRAEIAELHHKLRATVIYVTHDQVEAMTMADRVAVMVEGRILQIGAPQRLYEDPADVSVAAMLGSPTINLLTGRTVCGGIETAGLFWPLQLDLPAETAIKIGFRAESGIIEVSPQRDSALATVRHVEHLGSEVLVYLTLAQHQQAVVRVPPTWALSTGQTVALSIPAGSVLIFQESGARIRARTVSRLEIA